MEALYKKMVGKLLKVAEYTARYKWLPLISVAIVYFMIMLDKYNEYQYFYFSVLSVITIWFTIVEKMLLNSKITESLDNISKANRMLETLMYTMAHDLKSPVRSAAAMLDAIDEDIRDGLLDKTDIRLMMSMARTSLKLGMETIDEVLDYAKFGQNIKMQNNISVDKYIAELLPGFKGGKVLLEPLGVLSVDPKAFKRVIYNMVENGLKYNNKKEKIVRIYREGDVIIVEDNGNGVEEKYFDKIVKPFQRADLSTEGTGLGLGIVTKILDLHGFKLRIKSELGVGSKFEICL